MIEKGSHIKVRRELERLLVEHDQLVLESEAERKASEKNQSNVEELHSKNVEHKLENERLATELKSVTLDRDRLLREHDDQNAKHVVLQEYIQVCLWNCITLCLSMFLYLFV